MNLLIKVYKPHHRIAYPYVLLCTHCSFSREGSCKKMYILKLNRTGKFALNVVDNLVVVHHQDTEVRRCVMSSAITCIILDFWALHSYFFQTSVIFDIRLRGEYDGTVILHQPVLPARSIHPYHIPMTGMYSHDQSLMLFGGCAFPLCIWSFFVDILMFCQTNIKF